MIGAPRVHHARTDSTNERAKELARAGAPHGTLVTAGEQSAGRGRQGREWTARPGTALLMSLVLREVDELLPLAAAVAVCEAVDPLPARVKWPNDVWVEGRKLAGILIEGVPQQGWAVLGIGLNATTAAGEFPDELRETATSLAIAGTPRSPEELLDVLLPALDFWLAAPAEGVLAAWRERDALLGNEVRWAAGSGTAAGIDSSGALLVDTADGQVALDAGEVHLLRS